MRSVFMLIVLLALVIGRAAAQTDTHQQVTDAMEAVRQAALAGDADKIDELMADDCTFVNVSGRLITKQQYVGAVRARMVIVEALTYEDVAIRIYGNTAVVTLVTNIKERISGAEAGGRFRSTRMLVKDERGWRFVAVHATRM